jgi:hypothetical protein
MIVCDQCSRPIHWWNRRIWAAGGERCSHLRCLKEQLAFKGYVQVVAEEIRQSSTHLAKRSDSEIAYSGLQELSACARSLSEKFERLEEQLQQAEELAAKMPTDNVGNQPTSNLFFP